MDVRHSKFEFLFDRLESRVLGWILNTVVYGIYSFAKNQFSVPVQKRKKNPTRPDLILSDLRLNAGSFLSSPKECIQYISTCLLQSTIQGVSVFFSYRSSLFSRLKVGFDQHGWFLVIKIFDCLAKKYSIREFVLIVFQKFLLFSIYKKENWKMTFEIIKIESISMLVYTLWFSWFFGNFQHLKAMIFLEFLTKFRFLALDQIQKLQKMRKKVSLVKKWPLSE